MAGKADVATHLNQRRHELASLFDEWGAEDLSVDARADLLEQYFKEAELGETHRVGGGASLHVPAPSHNPKRANVLVVGQHGLDGLTAVDTTSIIESTLIGPGTASRFGPTVAFAEGLQAARTLTVEDPVNISFLSLSTDDSFASIGGPELFAGRLDAVYMTNAVAWNPHHPTLTTGSRGQVVAKLRLDAGASTNDYALSGAVRNPLTTMTQILGRLRDHRGRIVLPGFYDRAHAPDEGIRSALAPHDGRDPDEWADHADLARPTGNVSSTERASLWPGVSVLDITTDVADGQRAPGVVTATVAFYLVPDQRHAEVEKALRDWLSEQTPDGIQHSVKIVSATRPYRSDPESPGVAAQARAAYRLYGRRPVTVVAGGPAGSGELAFASASSVAFAGIARPTGSFGTTREILPWIDFEAGVALAAETCLALRRV